MTQSTSETTDLVSDTWNGIDAIEQLRLLGLILDVGVNQERIGLRMNPLHRILKGVEQLDYLRANLALKSSHQVLHDDSVRPSEERQDVGNEMLLIFGQLRPISMVLAEVNLLWGPEYSHALLVHLVQVLFGWLDREESEGRH